MRTMIMRRVSRNYVCVTDEGEIIRGNVSQKYLSIFIRPYSKAALRVSSTLSFIRNTRARARVPFITIK